MKLGGVEQTKEMIRDQRGISWLELLLQDLRFGVRMLRKNLGYTAVALLTLAIGIGASTAIFSAVYGVLLRPLPYRNADRIVQIWEVGATGNRMNFAEPNFQDLRAAAKSFEGMAEAEYYPTTVTGGSEAVQTRVAVVSRDFFEVLGASPLLGRGFTVEDQREGAAPVLLVSYNYWQHYLGGSPDLSKVRLHAEKKIFSVVGVMAAGFSFPGDAELWLPREVYPEDNNSRTAHNWHVYGRVQEGMPLLQARAELSTIARRLHQQYAPDTNMDDAAAVPLQAALTAEVRPALLLLLGAVGFLLLVACANVVNLLLAQAAARERELAIRSAIGAGRGRLIQQFMIEAILLCGIGGILGGLAAYGGVAVLLAMAPNELPGREAVSANLPVFLFAAGLSLLLAVALGIFTAVRATRGDVRDALSGGNAERATGMRGPQFGRGLITAQLALTLFLLVGAGLLGRSLLRVLSVDPGFRTHNIVAMDLSFSPIETNVEKAERVRVMKELLERLRRIPGVEAVGGANLLPLGSEFVANGTFLVLSSGEAPIRMEAFERLSRDPATSGYADYCVATEEYFRVLGIPLLRGRFFDDRDGLDATHVAVINDALARTRWPNEDPIGKTIEFGNMDGDLRLLTIVGVVGDVRNRNLETQPSPTVYVNYSQRPQAAGDFTVVMGTGLPPAGIIAAAREVVHSVDPNIPPSFQTFSQVFSTSLEARRFNLTLVAAFAVTALLLAAAGIYGVMAYLVSRRTREIGVRIALGASTGDVLRLVLGRGLRPVAFGVVIGIVGSFALTRSMQSLLYGVSPTDPVTLLGVSVLLASVSAVACYIPARRATKIAPTIALRYE